jgi:hypothetical protein
VVLSSSGFGTVATANEITYPNDLFDLNVSNCTINPAIKKTLVVSVLPSEDGSLFTTIRAFVQAPSAAPISDGTLYSCTFSVKPSTLPGTYTLFNGNLIVYGADGTEHQPVAGNNGSITVSLIGGS